MIQLSKIIVLVALFSLIFPREAVVEKPEMVQQLHKAQEGKNVFLVHTNLTKTQIEKLLEADIDLGDPNDDIEEEYSEPTILKKKEGKSKKKGEKGEKAEKPQKADKREKAQKESHEKAKTEKEGKKQEKKQKKEEKKTHKKEPTTPVEPAPFEPTPVEPIPVEPTPVEPTPVEPTPVEPTPVEPAPVEPTPVEPTPVEPAPVEPTPEEPAPEEPAPVEPTPVEPTPAESNPIEPVPEECTNTTDPAALKQLHSKKAEANTTTTMLQKEVQPKAGPMSYVFGFFMVCTFVGLFLIGTQYDKIKQKMKSEFRNDGLTDYLLIDEKHDHKKNDDYPTIRDI